MLDKNNLLNTCTASDGPDDTTATDILAGALTAVAVVVP